MENFKMFIEGEVIDFRTKKPMSPEEIKNRIPYNRAVNCLRGYIESAANEEWSDEQLGDFVEAELKEFIGRATIGRDFDSVLSALAYEDILALKDRTDTSAMKYHEMKGCYEILKK